MSGRLAAVNVGLPKDVPWQGKTVFTGVFKGAVRGPRRVRRLNLDGDGQGDLAGHGGEQRAVFVYQLDSYRHWERELGRSDFVHGQFGENFTVDGLGDHEVCIGDRYRIGSALFEVTQPRVTCYRVGLRMNDPRIPALLVSHRRPGFYFRVLEEGEVEAGDEIAKVASGPEGMTVAEVDGLLYLPGHPRQQLLRALRIPALSPGWQASFRALLDADPAAGNAGLAVTSPPPAWPGFRRLTVTGIEHESESVISIRLEDPGGAPLPAARPGQYLTLRIPLEASGRCCGTTRCQVRPAPATTGSPSSASTTASQRLPAFPARRGRQLDIGAPRGTFILDDSHAPVLLISAGVGATPVLAMLHALAEERTEREVWWLHGARSGRDHRIRGRGTRAARGAAGRARPGLLQPTGPGRRQGRDFDRAGRLTASTLAELEAPRDAEAYVCGPAPFMEEMSAGLAALGLEAAHIHTEPFGPAAGPDARHRGGAGAPAAPARGRAGDRPDDRVRPQQPRDPVERRPREPARARRGLRRARPLVVPHGGLPQLRDDADRGRRRLRPRPGRAPRRGQRARSAAHGRATTSCSTCERGAVTGRGRRLGMPRSLGPEAGDPRSDRRHDAAGRVRAADRIVLLLNTMLLMVVAFLPFATSVLADALRSGHGESTAPGTAEQGVTRAAARASRVRVRDAQPRLAAGLAGALSPGSVRGPPFPGRPGW